MNRKKLALIVALLLLAALVWRLEPGRFFSLEALQARQAGFAALLAERPTLVIGGYALLYVAVFALALPFGALLTLAGGALFGLVGGTVIVSFASSIGAALAFLGSRYLFADALRRRFGARLAEVDKGIQRDGAFYLFTLRLIPAVPPAAINLLFGLTPMKLGPFYGVSQLGMLPGTIVYVLAGTQLAQLTSLRGILTPGLVAAFVLLGLFPLLARRVVDAVKARRVYARWAHLKPRRYDRNLVVIGGGAAGLVASYIAAAVKARVTLVESHRMGGDCLNTGCVPSKALIRSATLVHQMRHSADLGIARAEWTLDFAQVMERVAAVVRAVEPHDSVERYTGLGVEVLAGHATLTSPWHVKVVDSGGSERVLSTRAIVVATGARPFVPPLPGLAEAGCLTSDTLWGLRGLPRRLLVLGGGPIGCELAQCFARLGSQVTLLEMAPRLLLREDEEVSAHIEQALRDDGVKVLTGHEALRCERDGDSEAGEKRLVARAGGAEVTIACDVLLCAVGRSARLQGFGLEELGIPSGRTLQTDEYLRTIYPNILACGDVAGPYQFTHTAAHQAWYASVNGLFAGLRQFKADYSVIPWCTFTDPEVARVGLNEQEAREQQVPHEVTRFALGELDRAIADGRAGPAAGAPVAEEGAAGFLKVLTPPGSDRILGVTIVGPHAGDLLAEWVLAMKHGIGLNKILGTIHTYPTLAESAKYAAGAWKRAHQPQRLLRWVQRYHDWRRG